MIPIMPSLELIKKEELPLIEEEKSLTMMN
jgi:hypothetical protein